MKHLRQSDPIYKIRSRKRIFIWMSYRTYRKVAPVLVIIACIAGVVIVLMLVGWRGPAGATRLTNGVVDILVSPDETIHEVVELERVTVHLVTDPEQFMWVKPGVMAFRMAGYATIDNQIWVLCRIVNGRIAVPHDVLGHELVHLLQFKPGSRRYPVHNPDRLEDVGA